jgi:1-acyl-sn-glycerol-3-phosphate acyltransferase
MQNIIIEKPYKFVPPHRGNWWPTLIQRFKLVDYYLRKHEGVEKYQIRGAEKLKASLAAGHGILLTPNHCRYADPLAIGWLSRTVNRHVFAMASWHLFHQGKFIPWAIRKMGGFSVYREGVDRQSLDTAIDVLTAADRPLVLFPEGAVFRSNDRLQALLDGVAFIARSAAKKRQKNNPDHKVVVHPVALKYLFHGDIQTAVSPILQDIEHRLTWTNAKEQSLIERIQNIGLGLLCLKELEHLGSPQSGTVAERQQRLIDHLLHPIESKWLGRNQSGPIIPRIKTLRMKIIPDMIQGTIDSAERNSRWRELANLYLAQQVASYPPDYLDHPVTVTRLLETVERYEEDLTDRNRPARNLEVVIEVGDAIEVSTEKPAKGIEDPLMTKIRFDLESMLDRLSTEAARFHSK